MSCCDPLGGPCPKVSNTRSLVGPCVAGDRSAISASSRRAPDLARARRLVAASGTAGMKVIVWNVLDTPQGGVDEADDLVQAFRQLGYRASLRVLPQSTFFAYINDSRN